MRKCPECDYLLEPEAGYFYGAIWIFNYTLAVVCGLSAAGLGLWLTNWPLLAIVFAASLVIVVTAVLSFPFCKSFWIYCDHWFRQKTDHL